MKAYTDAGQAQPCVAVVTVCKDALPALESTVQSVQAQRWPSLYHVVVDGASSDGTPAWLLVHRSKFAFLVSEPDRGIYDAMNKALEHCITADWIIFLNAGDRFADDRVLQRLAPMFSQPADMIFGDVVIGNPEKSRLVKARPHDRAGMPGCHQSMLVRAGMMRELRFDSRFRVGADFEFYLRATQLGARVGIYDGPIAAIAPEGFSARNEAVLRRDYVCALRRYRGHLVAWQWLLRRHVARGVRHLLSELAAGKSR